MVVQCTRLLAAVGETNERLKSAEILLKNERFLDCMYLAGYAPECALKALVLTQVPNQVRDQFVRNRFRGAVAHDLEHLRSLFRGLYREHYLGDHLGDEKLREHLKEKQFWEHLGEKQSWKLLTDEHLGKLLTEEQLEDFHREEKRIEMTTEVSEKYRNLTSWSPDLRYKIEKKDRPEAQMFLSSAKTVIQWAERSIQCLLT